MAWAGRLRGAGLDPGGDDLESWLGYDSSSPSVRFGLETALANLSRRMEDRSAAVLACFDGVVPVNGLLAGSREQVLADARRLRDGGCRAVKLKVGSRPVAEDVDLTSAVRSVIGDGLELRLDANRSWSLEQAVSFGREVGAAGIEYLEDPCATLGICESCSRPPAFRWLWTRAFWNSGRTISMDAARWARWC